jgi:membrane fusion protein (multidrug efflux system)
VVKNGKTVLAPVTIGRDFGTEVEVVAGVDKNDSVIENPSDSLTAGVAVHVAEPPANQGAK